jgi:protein TonB
LKKEFFISLVLHIAFLISALILLQAEQEKKSSPPFYANIVTPDEFKGITAPEKPTFTPTIERQGKKRYAPLKKTPAPSIPAIKTPKSPAPQTKPARAGDSEGTAKFTHPEDRQLPGKPAETGSGITGNGIKSPKQPPPNTKERLFDKDIIGGLSEQDNSSKKNDSITFDTKEYRYFGYMRRLKEKIEGIWNYPAEAIERRLYGDLYIRFTIKKDGRLGAVELLRTSGHKSLDDAALRALRDAEPFWPLPKEWNQEGFTIEGHFVYSMQGIYIR